MRLVQALHIRRFALAVSLLVAAAVGGAQAQEGPPLAGTVAKFVPTDPPKPLPELPLQDAAGKPVKFDAFAGKVVLLNLWATWCAPCVAEMPTLDRLQAKLGGAGFAVVALSNDRGGLAVVEPFYKKAGLAKLDMWLDPSGKSARLVGARGLPTTLLVDGQGREVGRLEGPAEWDAPETLALIRHYMAGAKG